MRAPRRGEIYRLQSDSVGKPRPVLIVSRNELNSGIYLLAIAFYGEQLDKRAKLPQWVMFQQGEFNLTKDCAANASSITQFKMRDLRLAEGPVGEVSHERMAEIDRALAYSLRLNLAPEHGKSAKDPS